MEQHLKAVADAEDEAAFISKLHEGIGQASCQFQRKDAAAGDVIAVGKAAGDAQDLEVIGDRRLLGKSPHVDAAADRTGSLEGVCRLVIAVGAGGPQDHCAW